MKSGPLHNDDEFDDPQMADLLLRWGAQVRDPLAPGGDSRLFQAPRRLSETIPLEFVTQADSGGITRRGGHAVHARPLISWALAVAACLLIVVSAWFYVSDRGTPDRLVVSGMHLSDNESVLRSDSPSRFLSGQTVYIHFVADREGTAYLATLDGRLVLQPVLKPNGEPQTWNVTRGANVLGEGRLRLDDQPGTESFILLVMDKAFSSDEFKRLLQEAATGGPSEYNHQKGLQSILARLRTAADATVASATFEHLAP